MRSKLILGALLLTLGVILASQFFLLGKDTLLKNNQPVEETETVSVEACWANWYPDFESLMGNFNLVVVGNVVESQLDPQDPTFTFHEVFVQEVIKDASNEVKKGNTVTIWQFGGIWAPNASAPPVPVEFRDSPLMKEGETSLLFLNHRDDGMYAGVSPQTRFIVQNGMVYWLGAVYEHRNIAISKNLQIEGEGLNEIISLLQQLPET